jgi:hypothetical protein
MSSEEVSEAVKQRRARAAELQKKNESALKRRQSRTRNLYSGAAATQHEPAASRPAMSTEQHMTTPASNEPTAEEKRKIFDEAVIRARRSRQAAGLGMNNSNGVAPSGGGISSDSELLAYDPHKIARLARLHIEEMAAAGVEVSDAEAVQHILSQPALVMSAAPTRDNPEGASHESTAEDASALTLAQDIAQRARVYTAQMAVIGIEVTAAEAVRFVERQM